MGFVGKHGPSVVELDQVAQGESGGPLLCSGCEEGK